MTRGGAATAARFGRGALTLLATILLGGFAASALVFYSPGFGTDGCEWNPAISRSTCGAMRSQVETSLPRFYAGYLRGALHCDFGQSEAYHLPVTDLLRDRSAVSTVLLLRGTLGGLALGCLLAWLAAWPRRNAIRFPAIAANGILLALPPAVLALFFFFREWPLWLGLSLAVLPRVFGVVRTLLEDLRDAPTLLAARARGLSGSRLAVAYVLGPAAPQLASLVGVTAVAAFGALVAIEALCDVPGVGQLVWKAALARDLPLLSTLALLVTSLVATVQWLGEFAE